MIRLTDQDGNTIYISPDDIIAIYDGGGWTGVDIGREEVYSVTESPDEVARKVLEYKLAMVRYPVGLNAMSPHLWEREQRKIYSLAGLEETGGTIE